MKTEFIKLIVSEVDRVLTRNYTHKTRVCACGCGKTFKRSNLGHFFYSRACYSRFHRIPGMFRKRMKEVRD